VCVTAAGGAGLGETKLIKWRRRKQGKIGQNIEGKWGESKQGRAREMHTAWGPRSDEVVQEEILLLSSLLSEEKARRGEW
jgi:hypothetical protein